MKIAHLLPYSVKFPLPKHNGRYEWALRLARLQAQDGHQVSFYSAPGSTDNSNIAWQSAPSNLGDRQANNMALFKYAFQNDHDIYHSHFDYLHYLVPGAADKPTVFTQHWFPDQRISDAAKHSRKNNILAVPSTTLMAETDKQLGIKHTSIVRQGIDLLTFRPTGGAVSDRLIFVGRIAPWKGVLEAVQLAAKANQRLDIVGKINPKDQEYWRAVEAYVDGDNIRYLGPKSQSEIPELLSRAKAFLFPSQLPEAAPQAPIEAQACGTPVIMSGVGATKEWLNPGVTGFIADSEEDYIDAIKRIDTIDRNDCVAFARQFNISDLVNKYYRIYSEVIEGPAKE